MTNMPKGHPINSISFQLHPFGKTWKYFLMLLMASFLTLAAQGKELRLGDIAGQPGDSVVLPVTVTGTSPITGMQFDFVFPAGQADSNRPVLESPGTAHRVEAEQDAGGWWYFPLPTPLCRPGPSRVCR
jgi:hypothetical protein